MAGGRLHSENTLGVVVQQQPGQIDSLRFGADTRSDKIIGPNVLDRNRVRGGFDIHCDDGLDIRKMTQQSVKLALKRHHLSFVQLEPGKTCDVSDLFEGDRHGESVSR